MDIVKKKEPASNVLGFFLLSERPPHSCLSILHLSHFNWGLFQPACIFPNHPQGALFHHKSPDSHYHLLTFTHPVSLPAICIHCQRGRMVVNILSYFVLFYSHITPITKTNSCMCNTRGNKWLLILFLTLSLSNQLNNLTIKQFASYLQQLGETP